MQELCNRKCGREAVVLVDQAAGALAVCATCFTPEDVPEDFRRPMGVQDPEDSRPFCSGCGGVLDWCAKPGFCEICESAQKFLDGLAAAGAVDLNESGYECAKDLQRGEEVA